MRLGCAISTAKGVGNRCSGMNRCVPSWHIFRPCVTGVGSIWPAFSPGKEPHAVSAVGRTDTASRNNHRLDGISRLFELFAHEIGDISLFGAVNVVTLTEESGRAVHLSCTARLYHREDAINVFSNDESGLHLPDDSKHCRPEVAVVCRSFSSSGCGERLAGEAPCENVNSSSPGREVGCLDVVIGYAVWIPII